MSIQRTLQKYMDDWKNISGLDFCLLTSENEIFVTTCSRTLPSEAKLEEFRSGNALIMANTSRCLCKVMYKEKEVTLNRLKMAKRDGTGTKTRA